MCSDLCEDVDTFFHPTHVKNLGSAEKAFEEIRRQFATMGLFRQEIWG